MQTEPFETIASDHLGIATGGANNCRRESMGYVNLAGKCEAFWSSAPGWGQNGFQGLDSDFHPLRGGQLRRLNERRAQNGEPAITAKQARQNSRQILGSR